MPSGPVRHGPSASQSQPKSGPGSVLTAQVPAAVNRKKAKRRAKEAAKKAAEQSIAAEDTVSPPASVSARNGAGYSIPGAFDQNTLDPHNYPPDDPGPDDGQDDYDAAVNGEYYYSDAEASYGNPRPEAASKSRKKKRRNKRGSINHSHDDYYDPHHSYSNHSPPPPPPPLNHSHSHVSRFGSERIWSQSGQEERENIREFWMSLEESERRSLVKVEKEAVLKKMKEQQKHSCSCSVCGRKRTAIEEELEVLYDAYYEELEQYANRRVVLEDGTVISGPEVARIYPPVPSRLPPFADNNRNGPQSRFQEESMEDEDEELEEPEEEFYSDEEEYDDEYEDDDPRSQANEFFNFGNSLTVQGGILTVADDLLKNDGKKFIEMMEQLAERRMRREEDAQYAAADSLRHAQQQFDDDDGYDDDDYATDDDDYPEDDEQDEEAVSAATTQPEAGFRHDLTGMQEAMTEEQRMEEGRRMFQIFAARMFEQRVLTAYREKVARERQEKLLEELEDEKDRDAEREAQKARKSAKAKEKKQRQKQQKEEEKAKKEAERKAALDAAKAEEERKAEEQRRKREELKKKREDEKRRVEEERTRKEEEKRRKAAEARKLQEEQERRQKELKEKERLKREEAKKRELEERALREREAKERREREVADKREKEAKSKSDRQAALQAKKAEQVKAASAATAAAAVASATASAVTAANMSPPTATPAVAAVPVPPLLRKRTSNASVPSASNAHSNAAASPHLQVATPVIPKAPSPSRQRQYSQQESSFQGSHQSSPKSGQVRSGSSATSPSTTQQIPAAAATSAATTTSHYPTAKGNAPSQPMPQLPMHSSHGQPLAPPPGMPYPPSSMAGMPMNGFPSGFGPPHQVHPRYPPGHDPMFSGHGFGAPYRGFGSPNGMPFPPGMNGVRPIGSGPPGISPVSSTSPHPPGVGGIGAGFGMHSHFPPAPGQRTQPHSRQPSASLEKSVHDTSSNMPAQPIGPPAPIKRPSSSGEKSGEVVDELSKQLGSSALLDDDGPLDTPPRDMAGTAGGGPPPTAPFGSAPLFQEPFRGPPGRGGFTSPGMGPFHPHYPGPGSTSGWNAPPHPPPPGQHFASSPFGMPRHSSRPVWLRMMLIEACTRLSKSPHTQSSSHGGFHSIESIANEINAMRSPNDPPFSQQELLDICDTEGNQKNGGGSFIRNQGMTGGVGGSSGVWIKFDRDGAAASGARHSVGEIGSPIIGHASLSFGGPGNRPFAAAPGSGGGGVSPF